jgi:hypothetical protein
MELFTEQNEFYNGMCEKTVHYKMELFTEQYELHNGNCEKTVQLQNGTCYKTICVTKRYMSLNGTFLYCTMNAPNLRLVGCLYGVLHN